MAHDAFLDELIGASADLDRLIADRQNGHTSQTRHEVHVDQAGAIAKRLREAGRGPGRPVSPPIGKIENGYAW